MGVRYLNTLITTRCKRAITPTHFSKYRGTTIVVDTSIYVYKYLSENTLMESMYFMMAQFRFYDITPIFVFDGVPPPEKHLALKERDASKKTAEIKYRATEQMILQLQMKKQEQSQREQLQQEQLQQEQPQQEQPQQEQPQQEQPQQEQPQDRYGDRDDNDNGSDVDADDVCENGEDAANAKIERAINGLCGLRKRCIRVHRCEIASVKRLMRAFDMRYIEADGEADVMCAQIVKIGVAQACMSDDMDMFLFGCPRVLRHINLISGTWVEYDLNQILRRLDVSISGFREICILFYEWMKQRNSLFHHIDIAALKRVYQLFSAKLTSVQIQNLNSVLMINNGEGGHASPHRADGVAGGARRPLCGCNEELEKSFEVPGRVKKLMAQYNFIYI
jgi:5'-3' exonuclease